MSNTTEILHQGDSYTITTGSGEGQTYTFTNSESIPIAVAPLQTVDGWTLQEGDSGQVLTVMNGQPHWIAYDDRTTIIKNEYVDSSGLRFVHGENGFELVPTTPEPSVEPFCSFLKLKK